MKVCKDCGVTLANQSERRNTPNYNLTGYCRHCVTKHKKEFTLKSCGRCKTCNLKIFGKSKRKKFCNQRCVQRYKSVRFNKPHLFEAENSLLVSKGYKPKRGQIKKCQLCNVDVYVQPCFLKSRKIFFCSRKHQLEYQKLNSKKINIPCKVCGTTILVVPSTQKHRPRSTCSKDCSKVWRRMAAESRRQTYTKHQIDRLARYSIEAEEWRKEVFKRDNYTCQFCGVRGTYLEADHIKPWAYFPELRFELSNGRTLCKPCHNTTKISAKQMRELYGKG